jgi:TRAP-type C4-dicarboxylate transport system substrate-binding protein
MARPLLAFLAALTVLLPGDGRADETIQLKLGSAVPPTSWPNTRGTIPWTKAVEKDSGGLIQFQTVLGGTVVTQRNTYDRLLNGVVDAAYGPFGAITNTMPRQEVTALPFESPGIVESAAAAWELVKKGIFAEDFSRIHIITTWCMPQSVLHTTEEVKSVEDFKGMKLSSATRTNGEISERLGATVVTVTNPEVYGALQRGMVQGLLLPDSGAITFHLQEVTKYHLGGLPLGCTTAGFFMNKDSYARLPAKLRKAIDDASGDDMARHMARAAVTEEEAAHKEVAAVKGAVMQTLSKPQVEEWRARLSPMAEAWVKATPDGEKVLAAYRVEIAKIVARN